MGPAVRLAARLVQADQGIAHDLEVVARLDEKHVERVGARAQVTKELQAAQQRTERPAAHVVHRLGEIFSRVLLVGSEPEFADLVDHPIQIVPVDPALDTFPFLRVGGGGVHENIQQFGQLPVETAQQGLIASGQLIQLDTQVITGVAHLPVIG